jgi:hypothetical protein
MKMHLGKSYLTNNSISEITDWVGVRPVGGAKDNDVMTLDEETTEQKRLLLLTNKERGVKEGESDFEFHKDVLLADTDKKEK